MLMKEIKRQPAPALRSVLHSVKLLERLRDSKTPMDNIIWVTAPQPQALPAT